MHRAEASGQWVGGYGLEPRDTEDHREPRRAGRCQEASPPPLETCEGAQHCGQTP